MGKGLYLLGLLLASCLLLLGWSRDGQAAGSAVYVDLKKSEAPNAPVVERWKLYGSSHVLVIGIDDYSGGWPRLSNAVKDARKVADSLTGRGFEVRLLTNVKSAELRQELRAFFAIKGADPEARLFFWFAGHGHTLNQEGYIVPSDATSPDSPEFLLSALPMRDFGSLVRLANAKHSMAVFDSCFSGTVFSVQRSRPPAAVTQATLHPVRQFLTSGDADQEVSDDGTFRKLFLDALEGDARADANGDGYLTGTELSLFLEDQMTNLSNGLQAPRSGKLRDARFNRGDFVFVLPNRQAAKPSDDGTQGQDPRGPSERTLDLEFWNAIKTSNDPADFKAYLEKFPNGTFVALARKRAQGADRASATGTQSDDPRAVAVQPSGSVLDRNQKRQIQQALQSRGYYRGAIDGLFGKGTEAAVRQYQTATGEGVTGILTEDQARRLLEMRLAAATGTVVAAVAAPQKTSTAGTVTSGQAGADPTEVAFWTSISNSRNSSDFRAYLAKYGESGAFAALARNRLAVLKAKQARSAASGTASSSGHSTSGSMTQRQLSRSEVDEAADAILQARQMMVELSEKADSILGRSSVPMEERIRSFRGMLGQVVDFEPMAKFVLGRHRAGASPAQWESFLLQYQELFLSGYEFTAPNSWTGDWNVQNIRPFGKKDDFLVTVSFRKKTGDYTKVGFRVRPKRGSLFGFAIIDAMTKGVSLLVTQKSEFSGILKSQGIDGLVRVLEQKYGKALKPIDISS